MVKKNWGEKIYSGEATFGRINAVISAIVVTFISIVLIAIGIFLMIHKSHLKRVQGIVTYDSQCNSSQVCDENRNCHSTTSCITSVTFTLNGKEYKGTLSTGGTSYKKGDTIYFYYDPNNPSTIESSPAPNWLGWLLIGVALILLFGAWTWVYITQKSKTAAAVGGATETVGMIRNALH